MLKKTSEKYEYVLRTLEVIQALSDLSFKVFVSKVCYFPVSLEKMSRLHRRSVFVYPLLLYKCCKLSLKLFNY